MFEIEEVNDGEDEEEYANKLNQFVEVIEADKVTLLEDLATEFKLSSKDVADRIKRLEELGRLNGIADDRGKYIHITNEEYDAVTNFIKKKGRINKNDLLHECNRVIRLTPTN